MKIIDTKSYLDTLCELTEKDLTVSTVVTGGSMSPFLASNRDFVYLEKNNRKLKKGDIVLFKRTDGDYVLHRIRYIRNQSYFLIGDSQTVTEGPIKKEQISAVVTKVKRKGKILTPKNLTWKFYKTVWLRLIFLRPIILKTIRFIRKK